MKLTRILVVPAIAAALLLALTGCFGNLFGGGSGGSGGTGGTTETETVDLTDTTWSGTDSVGDDTTFTFQADGTVAVTYNENPYDDPSDTWKQSGNNVTVVVFIDSDRGNATYTGTVDGDTMQLSAVVDNGDDNWTVTLSQE